MAKKLKKKIPPQEGRAKQVNTAKLQDLGDQNFSWAIRSDRFDWKDEYWGFPPKKLKHFFKVVKPALDSYASMKWKEIVQKKSCHPCDIYRLSQDFEKRINEIFPRNCPETLYQIRVNGRYRLWGERDNGCFFLFFDDQEHKGYPVAKKNT